MWYTSSPPTVASPPFHGPQLLRWHPSRVVCRPQHYATSQGQGLCTWPRGPPPSLRYLLLSRQDTSRSWFSSFTHYPTPPQLPGIGGPRALSGSLFTLSQGSSSHWVSTLLMCSLTDKLISLAQWFHLIPHPCTQLLMGHTPWMSGEHLQPKNLLLLSKSPPS